MSDVIEFKSAFDAVRFALCYSSQQYGETMLAKRLRGESIGTGMGLVGLDGAGQAGEIRRHLWELPELHLSVVVARAAPRDLPCPCGAACCSGWTPNLEWQAAIGWLTRASAAYCSGFSHYRVRRAIIERLFGVKCDLSEIADECGAHRNTVSKQNAAVRLWIEGDRKGESVGVAQVAWREIERKLNEIGLLKESETT
ncbi:DNA-binding protein [Burkholderia multivorans]|uniref:DNA-binding protein n=1 Tax=Burkholderia multivorans TaxID=87883 RepID=UPI002019C338|nr:DNA-binding protein [Burkholderia multivorans]UQN68028.1 DNA-binding protein [Burkholderia multivorans]UQN73757.1 DNA-binding protein [Burkholderia multivorans]HEJ2443623.1 DNA-binding protein [Burkholderia multivorans]